MLVAIVVTFLQKSIDSYWEIALGMIVGGTFGAVAARKVRMTAMPQMVALFNGVGGGAAALISLAEFHRLAPEPGGLQADISTAIALSAIIGSISFSGSMVAFAKLQELIRGRPIVYPLQKTVNALLFGAVLAAGIAIAAGSEQQWLIWALIAGASLFGVLFVLPIGGADMPVVISLLNAFTGLAAAATGFELENNVLIVSGMLVGASGTFLTIMMGQAMNRSIANVLFGAFGQIAPVRGGGRCERKRRPGALRDHRRRGRDARLCAQGRLRARVRAWPSPRLSTTCVRSRTCSSRAASRCRTRSIRSPGGCRDT